MDTETTTRDTASEDREQPGRPATPDRSASPDRSARPGRSPAVIIALIVFVAGLVLVGMVSGWSSAARTEVAETSQLTVRVDTAQRQTGYTVVREFAGRIEARRSSTVGFELGGQLASLKVDEGDSVNTGDLVARLDTERLAAQRRELVAVRDQTQADLDLAQSTHERVREARELDAVSSQEDDEALTAVRARKAALARAEAAIDRLDVELEKSRLSAPYNALVAQRMVDEGQVLTAGQPVLELLERTSPEARVGVAGGSIDALVVDQSYGLQVEGKAHRGSLRAVLPVRRAGTRSVEAVFTLDTSLGHGSLLQGDLVRLELEQSLETPGYWLPMGALTESSRGLWAAFVVTGDAPDTGQLERRELEILHQETDRVYVRGTLEDGDRYVVEGLQRLVPGQRVTILPHTASAPGEVTP